MASTLLNLPIRNAVAGSQTNVKFCSCLGANLVNADAVDAFKQSHACLTAFVEIEKARPPLFMPAW